MASNLLMMASAVVVLTASLFKMIEEWEATRTPIEIPLVFKGEWKGQTVYYCYNVTASCLMCDIFYADGTLFDWTVYVGENAPERFTEDSSGWSCIYIAKNYPDFILDWIGRQ